MRYYEVAAKCGHMGKNKYIIKNYYVCAENGKEAANKTRGLARVKHHHKDAIRNVKEISYEEFVAGLDKVNNDPYFLAHSAQEQRIMCKFNDDEIIKEEQEIVFKKPTHARRRIINNNLIKDWKSGRNYLYE